MFAYIENIRILEKYTFHNKIFLTILLQHSSKLVIFPQINFSKTFYIDRDIAN